MCLSAHTWYMVVLLRCALQFCLVDASHQPPACPVFTWKFARYDRFSDMTPPSHRDGKPRQHWTYWFHDETMSLSHGFKWGRHKHVNVQPISYAASSTMQVPRRMLVSISHTWVTVYLTMALIQRRAGRSKRCVAHLVHFLGGVVSHCAGESPSMFVVPMCTDVVCFDL